MCADETFDHKAQFEMPYLMTGTVDWGLEHEVNNHRRVEKFLSQFPVLIKEYPLGKLMFRDTRSGGEYCYIENEDNLAHYYMLYETRNIPYLGKAATQVKIWNSGALEGITRFIFFNIMLGKKFDSMVSDREQTEAGRRFWISILRSALERGLRIGFKDGDMFEWYDSENEGVNAWIRRMDGWGRKSAHYERLFVISCLIPST